MSNATPEAELVPGMLIFRPNGLLFFANANRIRSRVRSLVNQSGGSIKNVLVDLEASPEIDVTSLDMLEQLRGELQDLGVRLGFARVGDRVRDLLQTQRVHPSPW
jgi:MFS superfamily sulfate permease-like transporter